MPATALGLYLGPDFTDQHRLLADVAVHLAGQVSSLTPGIKFETAVEQIACASYVPGGNAPVMFGDIPELRTLLRTVEPPLCSVVALLVQWAWVLLY
jgi:hypothetical protein